MRRQDKLIGNRLTRTCSSSRAPPTPLDGAYCDALLFGHLPVSQKTKPRQFSSV